MKKKICPKCNSDNITRILYGLMLPDALKEYEDKNKTSAIMGGCTVIEGVSPNFHCKNCGYEWK